VDKQRLKSLTGEKLTHISPWQQSSLYVHMPCSTRHPLFLAICLASIPDTCSSNKDSDDSEDEPPPPIASPWISPGIIDSSSIMVSSNCLNKEDDNFKNWPILSNFLPRRPFFSWTCKIENVRRRLCEYEWRRPPVQCLFNVYTIRTSNISLINLLKIVL